MASIAHWTYCDTLYVCHWVGGWLVGWVATRVICGQTVTDTVLDSTEVI